MFNFKKIIVIGCSGSGKTTFSRRLNKIISIPAYYLDSVYWNEDATHISRVEFIKKQEEIFRKKEWIIDGNYRNTLEMRIKEADLIFFFDIPVADCLDGVKFRTYRPELPCDLPVDDELISFVENFNTDVKPVILKHFEKYSDKKIITFKSRAEADEYLEKLKASFELWDVYDENRNLTGKTIRRIDFSARENVYHLAVHIWIKNKNNEWLISKRTANKFYPLLWECTGGSALAGESSLEAALREVKEELGVALPEDSGRIYKSVKREIYHDFCDVYLFDYDCDIRDITLQEDETCDAVWASSQKIYDMINSGDFIPLDHMQYVYGLLDEYI